MARLHNRLTPAELRRLRAPGYYNDGLGLYMQISRWGTKSWVFRYTMDGRTRYLGLGAYPNPVNLATAREKAKAARLLILEGKDPIDEKRKARDERRTKKADDTLFKDAVEQFLKLHEAGWKNAKHRWQWQHSLGKYAKALMARPLSEITGAVITETLAPIWSKTPETARRTKQRIERICQWVKDGMPLPNTNGKTVKHHPALPFVEVPEFMADLAKRDGMSARALEFLILTAARTSEVLNATWAEIDGNVWTIPAERMKASKAHRVPLSARALALLDKLPRDGSGYLFPGASEGRPLSNMAMRELMKHMRPGFVPHGMRSAFTDWARERRVADRDVVELALAHAIADKTERAYRRGDALHERVKLMERWAEFCSTPVTEATVTPLRAAQ